MTARLLFVHALSPLHAGTGQSTGAIELAIARDRATHVPLIPASSIKGTLRDRAKGRPDQRALFGPDRGAEHAGALVFGDANLLCLPVRSIAGTFAWVTSPLLLARYARDCQEAGIAPPPAASPSAPDVVLVSGSTLITQVPKEPPADAKPQAAVSPKAKAAADPKARPAADSGVAKEVPVEDRVVFEDLDFKPEATLDPNLVKHIALRVFPDEQWQKIFTARLCVVHDEVMSFLSEHGTDVVARVALNDDLKTVDNLWHEEALPTESILVGLVDALPNGGSKVAEKRLSAKEMFDALEGVIAGADRLGVVQLGGKATVGRGRCRLVLRGEP